jgi:threonine synthase
LDLLRYIGTRDPHSSPQSYSFEEVLLGGLANRGGLFVPDWIPELDVTFWRDCARLPYAQLAARVMTLFTGEAFSADAMQSLASAAYREFSHPAVVPLVQLEERLWLMELFHGPTLSFKDIALQLVGRLFDEALARRHERVTVVGATSGDTGSAAIAACRDRAAIDIFVLYPHRRISEVQRRQMTTADAPNAHAVAIEGTFDDCQDLVKALFADTALCQELNLGAVNSINWARIAAQAVYYFAAGHALGAPARPLSFSVPTGNFGNAYAGHLARRLGLPMERLVIGTNRNDSLARYFAAGRMTIAAVEPSLSPSMDIQVPSNFERLLFELKGGSGAAVGAAVAAFRSGGSLPEDDRAWRRARDLFSAHRVGDNLTMKTIAETYSSTGMLIDPHTAVAVAAARNALAVDAIAGPIVALASAHPAKFPDAVESATGTRPPLPSPLADLFERRERVAVLPNDFGAVRGFLRAHARRVGSAA